VGWKHLLEKGKRKGRDHKKSNGSPTWIGKPGGIEAEKRVDCFEAF
jgi:hypothetical protein